MSTLPLVEMVREAMAEDYLWDADCIKPTHRAVEAFDLLLTEAQASRPLPCGIAYPNGEGGIRVEWRTADQSGYVLLSVHREKPEQDYIYRQQGSALGIVENRITSELLTRRLTETIPA